MADLGAGAIEDLFGDQDVINATGSTSAVSDTGMSVAGDKTDWTNNDDAKKGAVTIKWQYPSGTISSGAVIALYARKLNTQSTNDESAVDASNKKHLLGVAKVDEGLAATTDDYITFDVTLSNAHTSQIYEFYWENLTGVTMSAGWAAWIRPKSTGVKT